LAAKGWSSWPLWSGAVVVVGLVGRRDLL